MSPDVHKHDQQLDTSFMAKDETSTGHDHMGVLCLSMR